MDNFPPAAYLIGGAVLLAVTRSWLRALLSLALPIAALWQIWTLKATQSELSVEFLEQTLTVVRYHPAGIVFATIFAIMAFGGALFAMNQDRKLELPAAFFYAGGALGVACSGDWISMLIFWELMALGSTVVVWCGGMKDSAGAGLRYVAVHLVGGVILMAGIISHVMTTGQITFDSVELDSFASWLILIGMLINAAAPPFCSWLADAYPEASVSGTVFLSAFTTKTAVFTIMVAFRGEELLIYVGTCMAVWGIVYAILENDMRRILGYSIINQVGFMICGIGIGTEMAINGATAHAFVHIIYKALLLMSAGSVIYMTGKRKCTDLGGLYRTMPITMWCGIIGALAISAFPWTSGFVAKSMISTAAGTLDENWSWVWLTLTAASGGVFLHAGIKFPWFVFFQKDSGLRPKDPPWNMRIAMILFAAACVGIGCFYQPLYSMLPYPVDYEPYTQSHVANQLQLLMFAGLAFFLLLPMLKRTESISLDFDCIYRRYIPLIWRTMLRPIASKYAQIQRSAIIRAKNVFTRDIHVWKVDHLFLERWPLSYSVVLITLLLLGFLLFNFFVSF